MVSRLSAEVVPEEESPNRVQHAARHLQHVLHDLLHGGVRDRHVYRPNGDHEIQSGDDIASVLYKLVKVGEVVSVLDVRVV